MSTSTFLNTAALARQLGVAEKTIRRQTRENGLPAHRVGRVFRYDPDEVARWLRERDVRLDESRAEDDYRAAVRRLVDQAPELSAEQADRISSILSGGQ